MAKFHCWDIAEENPTSRDDGNEIEAGDAEEAAEKHATNLDNYDPAHAAHAPEEKRIIKVFDLATRRERLVRVKTETVTQYRSETIDE